MAENNVSEMIKSSLEGIRTVADSGTVLGEPISTNNGTVIIPVSKVTVGYASGGLDYAVKNEPQNSAKPKNFGAGGGTGLTVAPIGFIVIGKTGNVDFINVGMKTPTDPIGQITDIIDRSPEILGKIKEIFAKKPADKEADAEEKEEAAKAE